METNVMKKSCEKEFADGIASVFKTIISYPNDVIIISAENEQIKSNRMLLSFISPFVSTLFSSQSTESGITLPDCPSKSIKILINIVTSGFTEVLGSDTDDIVDTVSTAKLLGINLHNLKLVYNDKNKDKNEDLPFEKINKNDTKEKFSNQVEGSTFPGEDGDNLEEFMEAVDDMFDEILNYPNKSKNDLVDGVIIENNLNSTINQSTIEEKNENGEMFTENNISNSRTEFLKESDEIKNNKNERNINIKTSNLNLNCESIKKNKNGKMCTENNISNSQTEFLKESDEIRDNKNERNVNIKTADLNLNCESDISILTDMNAEKKDKFSHHAENYLNEVTSGLEYSAVGFNSDVSNIADINNPLPNIVMKKNGNKKSYEKEPLENDKIEVINAATNSGDTNKCVDNSPRKFEYTDESTKKTTNVECQICDKHFDLKKHNASGKLKYHYALHHFKEDLLLFTDIIKGRKCIPCNKIFPTMGNALVHVGGFHDKIDALLFDKGLMKLRKSKLGTKEILSTINASDDGFDDNRFSEIKLQEAMDDHDEFIHCSDTTEVINRRDKHLNNTTNKDTREKNEYNNSDETPKSNDSILGSKELRSEYDSGNIGKNIQTKNLNKECSDNILINLKENSPNDDIIETKETSENKSHNIDETQTPSSLYDDNRENKEISNNKYNEEIDKKIILIESDSDDDEDLDNNSNTQFDDILATDKATEEQEFKFIKFKSSSALAQLNSTSPPFNYIIDDENENGTSESMLQKIPETLNADKEDSLVLVNEGDLDVNGDIDINETAIIKVEPVSEGVRYWLSIKEDQIFFDIEDKKQLATKVLHENIEKSTVNKEKIISPNLKLSKIDFHTVCQICYRDLETNLDLATHYIVEHFQIDLQKYAQNISDKKCVPCKTPLLTPNDELAHIIINHVKIHNLLVEKGLQSMEMEIQHIHDIEEDNSQLRPVGKSESEQSNFDQNKFHSSSLKSKLNVTTNGDGEQILNKKDKSNSDERKINSIKKKKPIDFIKDLLKNDNANEHPDINQTVLHTSTTENKSTINEVNNKNIENNDFAKENNEHSPRINKTHGGLTMVCTICKKEFQKTLNLAHHLCEEHFKSDLKSYTDIVSMGKCLPCNKTFSDDSNENEEIRHVGVNHRKIHSILDAKCLDPIAPKSKEGFIDCLVCTHCGDKTRYGGPNKMRQSCKEKPKNRTFGNKIAKVYDQTKKEVKGGTSNKNIFECEDTILKEIETTEAVKTNDKRKNEAIDPESVSLFAKRLRTRSQVRKNYC